MDIVSDICDAVAAWEQAFVSEASLDRYRRACAWTTSEVAKAAAGGATAGIDRAFSNPTPWMMKAFGYTRALTRTGDVVSADLYTKPSQSIVMKYAMGDGPQIRRPGDVGLAQSRILVPNWRNLQLTQGINRNAYGNLPGGVAARLAREAAGTKAKRRVAGRWGVYEGEVAVGGSRLIGYGRPTRSPNSPRSPAGHGHHLRLEEHPKVIHRKRMELKTSSGGSYRLLQVQLAENANELQNALVTRARRAFLPRLLLIPTPLQDLQFSTSCVVK